MILLIDNYDSFTFNLVQYLGELGAETDVRRNDSVTCDEAFALQPKAIVLSPGPCGPDQAGICLEVVKRAADTQTPLLGVCLGHQSIAQAFGGRIVQCEEIVHGKVRQIHHKGVTPMQGLPSPFAATRYHSLVVEPDSMPPMLETTAWSDDGVIMGLKHSQLPIIGMQFHPESIKTQYGKEILGQFLNTV